MAAAVLLKRGGSPTDDGRESRSPVRGRQGLRRRVRNRATSAPMPDIGARGTTRSPTRRRHAACDSRDFEREATMLWTLAVLLGCSVGIGPGDLVHDGRLHSPPARVRAGSRAGQGDSGPSAHLIDRRSSRRGKSGKRRAAAVTAPRTRRVAHPRDEQMLFQAGTPTHDRPPRPRRPCATPAQPRTTCDRAGAVPASRARPSGLRRRGRLCFRLWRGGRARSRRNSGSPSIAPGARGARRRGSARRVRTVAARFHPQPERPSLPMQDASVPLVDQSLTVCSAWRGRTPSRIARWLNSR